MNCPACGYFNPTGTKACFHCSLALPLSAGDATCPNHPDVKATGACSRCGTFGCGACLTQDGTDWLCAPCIERQGVLPWDERATLGTWRAWWRTSVMMISQPTKTCSRAKPDAALGDSLFFAALSTLVGTTPTILVYVLILIPIFIFSPEKDLPKFTAALVPVFALVYLVFLVVFQVAGVMVLSGIDHLALMLLGANPRSYSTTVRAHALSMGCYLVGLLPFCGLQVMVIWSLVLRIIANMHFHKTTGGKATLAVLGPVVLFCGGFFTLYAALIGLAASQVR
ncbi:MAG: YIP1 family protein [Archangium sp.]